MVRTVEIGETLMPDDLTPTEPEGESDALVAAIATEVSDGASSAGQDASPSAPLVEIGAYRRRLAPILVAAAAVVDGDDAREGVLIALSATDLAPGAAAEADIADSPLGTRILLDVTDLPPAQDGTYDEAWLRQSAEVGISAGACAAVTAKSSCGGK